jgi:site-specific DNA-methyltransferase (adenine-specific)
MKPYYERGGITIYHGDCRDVLDVVIPTESVDLVLTDPPYGINWTGHGGSHVQWQRIVGDDGGGLDLRFMLTLQCSVVAFGATCYPSQLPHRGRWICWDKRVDPDCDRMLGAPFEMAWTNATSGFDRIYRIMHGGVVNANGGGKRVHPTEKPVDLMRRIIRDYPPARLVLDPFMGSGTTLRAAKDMGRQAIGIEIDEYYCELAAQRLEQGVLPLEAGFS